MKFSHSSVSHELLSLLWYIQTWVLLTECHTLPSYSDKPTLDLFIASLSPVINDEVGLSHCVSFVCRFWRFWKHQHQPVSVVLCHSHTSISALLTHSHLMMCSRPSSQTFSSWRSWSADADVIWSGLQFYSVCAQDWMCRERSCSYRVLMSCSMFSAVSPVLTAQWKINTCDVDHTPSFCPLMSHFKSHLKFGLQFYHKLIHLMRCMFVSHTSKKHLSTVCICIYFILTEIIRWWHVH